MDTYCSKYSKAELLHSEFVYVTEVMSLKTI
jgi:hypothetical protein